MRPSELPDLDIGLPIALDTETSGLFADDGARVASVQVGWIPREIVADRNELEWAILTGNGVESYAFPFDMGVAGKPEDDGQESLFDLPNPNLPRSEWVALCKWLDRRAVNGTPIAVHNAPFDIEKMRVGTRHFQGVDLAHPTALFWDTQVVQKELDPRELVGLKETAGRIWGWSDQERRSIRTWLAAFCKKRGLKLADYQGRYDLVDWEVMEPYARSDTWLTIRLYWDQLMRLENGEASRPWVGRELALMRILEKMTHRGIPYAAGESLDVAGELRQRQERMAKLLCFPPTDAWAKRWLFGEMRRSPFSRTETGGEQLTAEHVQRFIDEDPNQMVRDAMSAWLSWSKLDTACSMWYEGFAEKTGPDGRLRTVFRQTQVRSGRLSVERVNLQAIPHDYRLGDFTILSGVATPRQLIGKAFQEYEERGWGAWELDLAQAELRVAARKAECKRMLALIDEGADLHGDATREILHVDKDDERWFPFRQAMKRGNFSLIFGVGWEKLQADIRKNTGLALTDTQARSLVDRWNGLYPEYQAAINRHERDARNVGLTRLVNGRARYYAPNEDLHKAFNQYVQGSLAEFGKDWNIFTEDMLTRWGVYDRGVKDGILTAWGAPAVGLLLTIHDSQVLLLPEDQAEAIIREIRGWVAVTATHLFDVPMAADAARWGQK